MSLRSDQPDNSTSFTPSDFIDGADGAQRLFTCSCGAVYTSAIDAMECHNTTTLDQGLSEELP